MRYPAPIVAQTDPLRIGGGQCIALPVGLVPWDEEHERTTIVARTTYAFDPNADAPRLEILAEQPTFVVPGPCARPGASELELEAPDDFALVKPRADVLLVGHAYASSAQARIDARIQVQDTIDLTFSVVGPSPIERMPLGGGFLRGADGETPIPPVGPIQPREIIPLREQSDDFGLTMEERIAQRDAAIAALEAGEWKPWEDFGMVDAADRAGADRAGADSAAADSAAEESELPEAAFVDPPDVESWDDLHRTEAILERGLQYAAAHLSCPFLDPDATIELQGLTPGGEPKTLQLPGHDVLVVAEAGAKYDVTMEIDTVLIDTDAGRVSLTWRGQVPVDLFARSGARLVVALGYVDRVPTLDAIYRNLPRGVFGRALVPEWTETLPIPRNDVELAVARQMTFDRIPDPILDMDTYTEIAAAISTRPDEREQILARHDLDTTDWMLEERAWTSRVGAAMSSNDLEAVDAFNKLMTHKRKLAQEHVAAEGESA